MLFRVSSAIAVVIWKVAVATSEATGIGVSSIWSRDMFGLNAFCTPWSVDPTYDQPVHFDWSPRSISAGSAVPKLAVHRYARPYSTFVVAYAGGRNSVPGFGIPCPPFY